MNQDSRKSLVVACASCGAQFRFNPTLFQGTSGARLRCRQCGKGIEVRNPDVPLLPEPQKPPPGNTGAARAPEVPAPVELQLDASLSLSEPTAARTPEVPESGETPPAAPPSPRSRSADAVASQRRLVMAHQRLAVPPVEPLSPPPEPAEAAPPSTAGGDVGASSGARGRRDVDTPASGDENPPAAPKAAGSGAEAGKRRGDLRALARATDKEEGRSLRSASLVPYIVLTLVIFLLAAGIFAFIETPIGGGKPRKAAVPSTGTKAAAPSPRLTFENIELYYQRNPDAGMLFVLKGRVVRPPALSGKGKVLVHASILDVEKRIIAKRTVPAGVVVPDEVLRYRSRDAIEAALSAPGPPEDPSAGAPRSGTIPFMIVFADVHDKLSSYDLSADVGQ